MYYKIIAKGHEVCLSMDDEIVRIAPTVNVYNAVDPYEATQMVRLSLCNNLDIGSIDSSSINLFTKDQELEVSILLQRNWHKIRRTFKKICNYSHYNLGKLYRIRKYISKEMKNFSNRRQPEFEDAIPWEPFVVPINELNAKLAVITTMSQKVHLAVYSINDDNNIVRMYKFYLYESKIVPYLYLHANMWKLSSDELNVLNNFIRQNLNSIEQLIEKQADTFSFDKED